MKTSENKIPAKNRPWYRLDTSAKIYPALESPENTNVFRFSMTLNEDIDEALLLKAMNAVRPRFPYFHVRLRTGFFWHYLEQNDNPLILWPESPFPCERLYSLYNNDFLYRVRVYRKRIAVEFFHILTDGSGGMEYLKTLVAQYLLMQGKLSTFPEGIINPADTPDPREYEDAFMRVLEIEKDRIKGIPRQRTLFQPDPVFKIRGKLLPLGVFQIINGTVSVAELKDIAKKHGLTVTELLAALYVEALLHVQFRQQPNPRKYRPVGMEIPVNMRTLYPIPAMGNFALFVVPRFDPRIITDFADIAEILKSYMKQHICKEHLLSMAIDNCALSENLFIRHTPVFIKDLVIRYLSQTQGHAQFSGTISNLGAVRLPQEMEEQVADMAFMLGPPTQTLTSCAVLGYKDEIRINFGRVSKDTPVERHLFRRLVELGAHVRLTSN
ncbi:MAG: hypothetical protein WC372_01655 [Candidatus Neomarinimicrobiota bacterium]|jgi:NRPS condensation-like uncharacterized protein|nr:hypothetical protein [Candidatus Neomarinimicrobiota bacterium]